jgi:hypothetical protein
VGHKHVPESELIQFRVSRELAARLSAAAFEQELSRSEYLRRLTEQVLSGELVALPDLLDADADIDLEGLSRRALAVLDERLKAGGKGLPGTGLMNLVERFLRVEEERQRERAKAQRTPQQEIDGDESFIDWLDARRGDIGEERFQEVAPEYVALLSGVLQRARRVLGVDAEAEAAAVLRYPRAAVLHAEASS